MGNSEGSVTDTYGGGSIDNLAGYTESELLNNLVPASEILLRFKCDGLPNLDKISKSDPFIVVTDSSNGQEIGRTEVIKNSLNPNFSYSLKYIYKFEQNQTIKISVYDAEQPGPSKELILCQQDFIGSCSVMISRIVTGKSDGYTEQLVDKSKSRGTVTIFSEEISDNIHEIRFEASITEMNTDDSLFFIISSLNQSHLPLNCFRSETAVPNQNIYKFRNVKVDSIALCNGDEQRSIIFTVYKFKSNGSHTHLGECKTTLRELRSNPKLPLVSQKQSKNTGFLVIKNICVIPKYSFFRYIKSGCELNFMVGIDFTASNGKPMYKESLHHIDPVERNLYEQSIISVGSVLEYYDTNKSYPTYFFGGKVNGKVEHCYPLNGNYTDPEVHGVQDILQHYRKSVTSVKLFGPTCFAPLIKVAAEIAKQYDQPNVMRYLILLIITDGVINDMGNTLDAIIDNCLLPLSIIIIGVGNADFTDMETIDGDQKRLQHGSRYAQRDIVQFVSFSSLSKTKNVAAEVLAEVPRQLTEYMNLNAKIPR